MLPVWLIAFSWALAGPSPGSAAGFLAEQIHKPLPILLLQILTVLLAAKCFGFLCRKMGQPAVIGEIIAGIALGPSLLGMWFPKSETFLFQPASMGSLQSLSQIGLILFMFLIGCELDKMAVKMQSRLVAVISLSSIVFPFALGVLLSFFLVKQYALPGINPTSFSLFIGIAMSITAFPVLARIIQERNLGKTSLGALAMSCAAINDLVAWCLLAALTAIVKADSPTNFIITLFAVGIYLLGMAKLAAPFLSQMFIRFQKEGKTSSMLPVCLIVLVLSSFLTEVMGIHALFGAFVAGIVMPREPFFQSRVLDKIEELTLVLLLPLFFVFTGLKTQIGLLDSVEVWTLTAGITGIAFAGKFLGSAVPARLAGQSLQTSLSLGALMNTRGLVELVVLNIGYDLHILPPTLFTMFVIMALLTTLMTGPLLHVIERSISPS